MMLHSLLQCLGKVLSNSENILVPNTHYFAHRKSWEISIELVQLLRSNNSTFLCRMQTQINSLVLFILLINRKSISPFLLDEKYYEYNKTL